MLHKKALGMTPDEKIQQIIEQQPVNKRDALIVTLQNLQDTFGFINEGMITKLSRHFGLPTSKIYGVASFYNQFRFEPKGKYHIRLCKGTACHLLGATTLLQEIEKLLKIKPEQTSKDKKFSLEVADCIGACALAPVIQINNEYYNRLDADRLKQIIQKLSDTA